MATNSALLRLTLQANGENPNSWGQVANNGVFQLLEDSIAGVVDIVMSGVNKTLTTVNGADDESRRGILHITGPAASNQTIFVPAVDHLYAVVNESASIATIDVVLSPGNALTVAAGDSVMAFCDGTSVFSVSNPSNVATADLATNSLQLGGVAAAAYAQLTASQTFTKAQAVERVTLTAATNVLVDANLSNTFELTLTQNLTINTPTNPVDGQTMRFVIRQDATGGRTVAWQGGYAWGSGTAPVISTAINAVDYISFEYSTLINKWIGGFIQDIS